MAIDEEVESPPFPNDRTTVPRLLEYLQQLRGWVEGLGDWANTMASDRAERPVSVVPLNLPTVPDVKHYLCVSVPDIYWTYAAMRNLRASWDRMFRVFEHDWNHEAAIRNRIVCVQAGVAILTSAFVSPEHREAHNRKHAQRHRQLQKKLLRKLGLEDSDLRELHGGFVDLDELFDATDEDPQGFSNEPEDF